MKRNFFYVFLGIFALTAIVTLLGVTRLIVIDDFSLKSLFGSLLLELVTTMIVLFRSTKFFEESLYTNVDEYIPSTDAARVLQTLFLHQEKMDPNLKRVFTFVIHPPSGDFPRYLRGLSELVSLGLVDVNMTTWQCGFTTTGYSIAKKLKSHLATMMPYIANETG
jgi:hypothetical protein